MLKIFRDKIFISFLLFALLSSILVNAAYANVPTVGKVESTKEGNRTILKISISHSNPSSGHYVDIIEIDVDGTVTRIDNIEPQTSVDFEYEHDLGELTGTPTIKVRANCNLHGWSPWFEVREEEEEEQSMIPGFPWEATALGIIGASYPLIRRRLKKATGKTQDSKRKK
jgi:desulfoferrodoxin (superoxide reductase-like protein)